MKPFRLSPEARRDVQEVWAYIARDSIEAAAGFAARSGTLAGGWLNTPTPVTSVAISRLVQMFSSGRYILTSSSTARIESPSKYSECFTATAT